MFLARTHVGTAEHGFFEVETPTAVTVLPSWALRGRGIEAARAVRAQAAAAREAAVRPPAASAPAGTAPTAPAKCARLDQIRQMFITLLPVERRTAPQNDTSVFLSFPRRVIMRTVNVSL